MIVDDEPMNGLDQLKESRAVRMIILQSAAVIEITSRKETAGGALTTSTRGT
jgi:hypothetical protein